MATDQKLEEKQKQILLRQYQRATQVALIMSTDRNIIAVESNWIM